MRGAHKINEIQKNVLSCSFSVILATETSWDEGVRSEEVFGCRYNVYRNDRNYQLSEMKSGGGVLIAVSVDFNSALIDTIQFKEFEHVWVKAELAGETHVFVSVYFPPNNARNEIFEKFLHVVENIASKLLPEVKLHIYGDFNQRNIDFIPDIDNHSILLPIIGENETLQLLFDKTSSLGLNQINHVKNGQNCYLDLLMSNISEDFCVTNSLQPLWKNEVYHTAIEFSLFVHVNKRPDEYEFEDVFDFQSANYDELKHKLNSINWQDVLFEDGNVDSAIENFYNILSDLFISEIPLKRIRRHGNSKYPVWYNRQIKNLKNKKQKAHKKYKTHKNRDALTTYLNICGELNDAISNAFEEFTLKTEFEIKSCPKNFFKYVKSKLKSENFPSKMQLHDKVEENPAYISDLFADFFQQNYTTFSESDRDYTFFTNFPEFPNYFNIEHVSAREIEDTLKSLDASKGPGPDGIPPAFMKHLAKELTSPLFLIFNMSLESGCFPKFWKNSYLVPVFKSGKKNRH